MAFWAGFGVMPATRRLVGDGGSEMAFWAGFGTDAGDLGLRSGSVTAERACDVEIGVGDRNLLAEYTRSESC